MGAATSRGGPAAFRASGKLARFFVNVGVWIGGLATLAMMLHVCLDVFLRTAFDITMSGTLEIVSFYYMVACICLSFPVMQLAGEQVVVEIFLQKFSAAALRPINLFAMWLTFVYVGLLAVAAAVGAWSATQDGEMAMAGDMDLITWPSRWINFAGLAVMALVVLWQIWAVFLREQEVVGSAMAGNGLPGDPS